MSHISLERYLVLGLLAGMIVSLSPAEAASDESWLTYTDPNFGFSISYPAGWEVEPIEKQEGAYGSVLTFTAPATSATRDVPLRVVVGLHTSERDPSTPMAEWSRSQMEAASTFAPSEVTIEKAEPVRAEFPGGGDAYTIRGTSPLGRFQITNITRGQAVWFIWTNGASSHDKLYREMVASFKLSAGSPRSFEEAWGFALPASHSRRLPAPPPSSLRAVIDLPGTWWAPTRAGTRYTVKCGSSYHSGTAKYAADLSMVKGTAVHSTTRGWVDFAGWSSDGYGNLIKASTDVLYPRVYTVYYAHLDKLYVTAGEELWRGRQIALSGSTGNSPAPHLHFHVRSGSDAVNLRNLYVFDENSSYPSEWAVCGTMYR